MNYIIDTHTFLWFVSKDKQLSAVATQTIRAPENHIYVSVASVWEMAIKVSIGRLDLPIPYDEFINEQLDANRIALLDITLAHTAKVVVLPYHHRDPFDRMIVAQCLVEAWPLIGNDAVLDAYEIQRIW